MYVLLLKIRRCYYKKILLSNEVTMTLLFAVGFSNSTDKEDKLKDVNKKEVELSSEQKVVAKKGEVLRLDITSTIIYKNYVDILTKIYSLSVDEIEKMIESSTDKFIVKGHINHNFLDSGHQLLSELRYSVQDQGDIALCIAYDGYNNFGEEVKVSWDYAYYDRRAIGLERVNALAPEYKPEFLATKEVSDMQQQIELLESTM